MVLKFFICSTLLVAGSANALAQAAAPHRAFSILGAMDGSAGVTAPAPAQENDGYYAGPIRAEIDLPTQLPPGSILVRTAERKLYFILAGGRAIVWRVAVGREGFAWHGTNEITRKAEWPDWRPPPEMIAREAQNGHVIPDLVKGGPGNPLGARALYIGETDYRIHGTDKPWSIGHASSSGCIRMLDESVTELFELAKVGAKVVVE